jgi:hypothetical protein
MGPEVEHDVMRILSLPLFTLNTAKLYLFMLNVVVPNRTHDAFSTGPLVSAVKKTPFLFQPTTDTNVVHLDILKNRSFVRNHLR